jgi:hypothetical protein
MSKAESLSLVTVRRAVRLAKQFRFDVEDGGRKSRRLREREALSGVVEDTEGFGRSCHY